MSPLLPTRPTVYTLQAFTVVTCGSLLAVAAFGWLFAIVYLVIGASVVLLLLLLAALTNRRFVLDSYMLVSRALRGGLAPFARGWISTVAYQTVLRVNKAGMDNRVVIDKQGAGWTPKEIRLLMLADAVGTDIQPARDEGFLSWIRALVWWSKASGNRWVLGLVPFMLMLVLLKTSDRQQRIVDTYTLY